LKERILTDYGERKIPARELRQVQTKAEQTLWSRLRDRKLGGFKFRRQFPIASFFADFCCVETRLVVAVDGRKHADTQNEDENRTHCLQERGFRVVRFWNAEVLENTEAVCDQIMRELKCISKTPLPSGEGGVARVRRRNE
jgi:very-short-patch-repair endonuclease